MRLRATLILVCIFGASAVECIGQSPKFNPSRKIKTDRIASEFKPKLYSAPKIALIEALKLAEDYLQKMKINVSEHSLVEAKLIYMPGKDFEEPRYWRFWWAKSGGRVSDHVEIGVFMDGRTGQWFN
jgi:hypothetical protein